MDVNPRAGIARSNRRNTVGTREPIKDLPTIEGVLTIIEGPHKAGSSRSACDRYAKEAKNPPQMLVYKADMHLTRSTRREPEDIVFMEADARWVHHPHTDALVVIVKMANSLIDRMLGDNGSATDILYWDAYRKIG